VGIIQCGNALRHYYRNEFLHDKKCIQIKGGKENDKKVSKQL